MVTRQQHKDFRDNLTLAQVSEAMEEAQTRREEEINNLKYVCILCGKELPGPIVDAQDRCEYGVWHNPRLVVRRREV